MALTQISTDGIKNGTITGSDLATNIDLVNNQKLRLGTGNDLQIYHDGTNSFIVNNDGDLLIRNTTGNEIKLQAVSGEQSIQCIGDGAVELYFDGSRKLRTKTAGVEIEGDLGMSDNRKIILGTGDDLQIYHDGTNSILTNSTGNLQIKSTSEVLLQSDAGETMFRGVPNNTVELRYDNVKKFETTSTGVNIHGSDTTGSNLNGDLVINNAAGTRYAVFDASHTKLNFSDNASITLGTSNDFIMFHDSSGHTYLQDQGNGALRIRSDNEVAIQKWDGSTNENMAKFIPDGAVELYHDNSKKFETTSSGVTVTGTINFGSGMGSGLNSNGFNINFADSDGSQDMAKFGDSGDLKIYHDSANSYIQNITGALRIYNHVLDVRNDTGNETILKGSANGSVELYYNNVKKLETTDVGITSLDTLISQGEIRPGPDNDHSIGRSNRRYITIFAVNGSINTSDQNEKNTIIDSDLGLDFINKLKPKSYKWNKNDGKTHYGLIAQDLEETLTSLGKTIADFGGIYKEDDSPMGLGYSELIAPLIKAVQELSAEVAALKAS